MALQSRRNFGNYHVVRQIGEGAFGEVYLAENRHLERRAAIKVLRPLLALDKELVRRFFNEARAASAIRHPNIIEIFDAGETPEGWPYILMEFLEGTSLKRRLSQVGRLSVAKTLEISSQTSSALSAAHAVGIVHRDLKPENLFLVPDEGAPGGERVKLLDFGIAKVKRGGGGEGTFRTEAGLIMGSPTYMSPEQCKDSADVDHRADIYSFATILYEMLAGRPPHVAATGIEVLLMHMSEKPLPLGQLCPSVPIHVAEAVMCALRQERSERFESMAAFLGALTKGGTGAPTETLLGAYTLTPLPSAGSRVVQNDTGSDANTFPPAYAQASSESGLDTHPARKPLGRWIGFALAGLTIAALGFLLLPRGGHGAASLAVFGASVLPRNPAAPAVQLPSDSGVPAILAGRDDSGVESSALVAQPGAKEATGAVRDPSVDGLATAGLATSRPKAPRARPTLVRHTTDLGKRAVEGPRNSVQHDQEDVAGF
jgi:serine/threonine-protein kinase